MPTIQAHNSVVTTPTLPNPGTATILVVEDEDLIRETITLALQDEGYTVQAYSNGRSALDLFYAASVGSSSAYGATAPPPELPDLIVLDLMLPLINGLDFCRFIRRQGSTVPILILSAKGTETDRVVGLEVGADDYLTKPFGMRELVARCRALLRRSQHHAAATDSPVLRFQHIALYPSECRVTLHGEPVNLSPKEFRILELFLNYPRRVWSREQLLERVWGIDFMGDSKTVDVHIRWLREKLEADPSHPQYLQTVRGFGYRFG
ncbi:MAG: response regulator transcription factor [Prochlorothrix sp.]|nr:response regulator transcription factor [Prochlorothrix sp.]